MTKCLLIHKTVVLFSIMSFLIGCNNSSKGTHTNRDKVMLTNSDNKESKNKEKTYQYYKVKDKSIPVDKVPPAGLYRLGTSDAVINVIIKDNIVKFQTGDYQRSLADDDATMDENGNISFTGDFGDNTYIGNGVIENSSLHFNGTKGGTVKFIKKISDGTQIKGSVTDSNNDKIYKTVTDIEGNVYKTVTIGKQVWMGENLKTTKFNDGTTIPLVTDNKAWEALKTPAYCWYKNDATANKNTYGALYNWYTIGTNKLCPKGWHVPTDAEWTTLTTYLGGENVAGGKLKETGTTHWESPNTGATNETGFTALPSGYRIYYGTYDNIGNFGYWWNSTESATSIAYFRNMYYKVSNVLRSYLDKQNGFSVRCLRDF